MMYGLSEQTIAIIQSTFALFPDVEKAILYGSRAKGNYRNGSDIDIALTGDKLTLENSVYPLVERFYVSDLPYSFDISMLASIESPELREHIKRVGKVLYRKDACENGGLKNASVT